MTDIIDQLAKRVSDLVSEIESVAKAKHTYTFSHDDHTDGDYEDVSNPSTDATDSKNSDDDEEDDDGDDMQKATINAAQLRNDRTYRPGDLPVSEHFKQRHKFEALTEKVKNEQGIPASEAQAYVRRIYPDVYRSFQRFTNSDSTVKRAPDLVEIEMRKGVTREVAMQRLAQLHGFRAFDNAPLSKRAARADDAEYQLVKSAQDYWANNDLSRCEALRESRLANPYLHRVLTRGG
jgi:hypothetical protein